ncbi:MAG TPA: PKD domain-containing protein, partial [Candidatus Hodarchaeales archaeon]|nr:PKD domain-containing protein [Candidatus Hodarchaeales archaeon]
PLAGSPGQSATFVANVDGTTPFTYSWNFGGGANPNTSTQASPAVTLAGAGSYNGSLTVTNSVDQDVFNFTLSISSTAVHPVITEVLMSSIYAGDTCAFGAIVTGTEPMTFAWNFGGGASPNTSSYAIPTVTLDSAGSYNGSLTVWNSAGSDTLAFSYIVYVYVPNIFETLDGSAVIFAQDGTYLGLISSNEFLSDSIMNQFGSYGSQFSSTSIFNQFGTYGSEFSYLSPWNEFASSPPLIFIGDVFIAYLTVNSFKTPAINPLDLITYLAAH